MPPENLSLLAVQLGRLEERHNALERENKTAVGNLAERLESHIEETDRQFATLGVHVDKQSVDIATLTKTVGEFISAHESAENTNRRRKMDTKDWLLVAIAFVTLLSAVPSAIQALKSLGGN